MGDHKESQQLPWSETDKHCVLLPLQETFPTFHIKKFAAHFNLISFKKFDSDRKKYGKDIVGFLLSPAMRIVINRELLMSMPNLKVINLLSVGYEILDLEMLKELGIRASYLPDVQSDACADAAIALLLAVSRRIVEAAVQYKDNVDIISEPSRFVGREVTGSTIGIFGLGSIGIQVAERAKGFRMKILYHNRRKRSVKDDFDLGAVYVSNLYDMLPQVDFLVLCCPLTSATRGIIGTKELEAMKPSAVLINISRGRVVNTDALVDALHRGVIGGAGLDVTDPEPLTKDHPLFDLPNVVVIPHMASAALETRNRLMDLSIENIVAGIEGKPMPSEIPIK
ncbi:probable 2-ketogluconate reductase [Apostichopus japonicus]|uniref:probable 2-ketogluconate reductase n=1 Tax=Stichopus japonicus TaxID=307972 RepID=UPI003AB23BAB